MSGICSICEELNNRHSSENLFWAQGAQQIRHNSRILYRTDKWIIMPTIGPLMSGHILIVSANHKASVGHCNIAYLKQLKKLINNIKNVFKTIYGESTLLFEHGPVSSKEQSNCCVEHAHLHAIPHSAHYSEYIVKYYEVKTTKSIEDVTEPIDNGLPYLYYHGMENASYIVESDMIPSQFFRRIIASDINRPELWDWRLYPRWRIVEKTIYELTNKISI